MTNLYSSSLRSPVFRLCGALSLAALTSISALGCAQPADDASDQAQESALVGRLGSGSLDPARTTHLLVVGYSHGQGDQFVRAALSRALRYKESFPDRQIVLFGSPEIGTRPNVAVFRGFGLQIVTTDDDLSDRGVLERMRTLRAIASFDFFGHSSPWAIGVASDEARLGTSTDEAALASVRASFTKDAYATLNGCNAGYVLAPRLSRAWQVPVSAALAASNFQQLHQDGRFYFNDEGAHPAGPWATTNDRSYQYARPCSQGACYRMKPENSPYDGYWGQLRGGGLGFYPFFCNYAGAEQSCSRRMALSLYGFPSVEPIGPASTRSSFERVVFDYLCPNDAAGVRAESCRSGIQQAVAAGSRVFSSFRGNALECADAGCTFDLRCDEDSAGSPIPGTCSMSAPRNDRPTALVREYLRLMDGYDRIHSIGPEEPVAIPMQTLESIDHYTVVPESLNCRSGAGTENPVERVFFAGQTVTATTTADRPRVQRASTGLPWLLVREGDGAPCYVSAQLRFVRPATAN